MLNKFNTLSLSFLFLMFVLAWGTTTAFAAETNIYNPSFVMSANGDSVDSDVIDSETTIDIECDATKGRIVPVTVSFYNNKIGFDFSIVIMVEIKTIIVQKNTINFVSRIYNRSSCCRVSYYKKPKTPANSVELSFKIERDYGCHGTQIYNLKTTATATNIYPYITCTKTNIYNPSFVTTANGEVTVSNLDDILPGERVEYNDTDLKGNRAFIGKELISTTATSKTWKVYANLVFFNCYFYITVTNNRITNAYEPWIMTVGCTYSNESLDWNSQYARLSFKQTSYLGLINGTCWLQATVTGSNNDIYLNWQF